MKHLKRFESTNNNLYFQIVYKYITSFHSEQEFRDWCLDENDQDVDDDVDWNNVVGYDLPQLFDLPTYDKETSKLISDVLTKINLDHPNLEDLRSGEITYDEWKETTKYNL